jgi:cytochrome c biogenesis protein CcdA
MFGLALLVGGIGVADSVNPSTLVPGLWLAAVPRARALKSFTLGVFCVYLSGGLVLLLGPGPALIAFLRQVGPQVEHIVEAGAGLVLVTLAVLAWRSRHGHEGAARAPRQVPRGAALALGAGIAAVELPTAFMYFGALSAILVAHPAVPAEIGLVTAYNALFVGPLLIVIGVRARSGERAEARLAAARALVRHHAPRVLAAVLGVAGVVLAGLGAGGLLLPG